jgi:hypothetical protein
MNCFMMPNNDTHTHSLSVSLTHPTRLSYTALLHGILDQAKDTQVLETIPIASNSISCTNAPSRSMFHTIYGYKVVWTKLVKERLECIWSILCVVLAVEITVAPSEGCCFEKTKVISSLLSAIKD